MALVDGHDLPESLFYDIENQLWYEPLPDGTVRAGFTPLAIAFVGDVFAFTPRRVGKEFEAGRSIATIEGGKWVGAARSAFDGHVVAINRQLIDQPSLLTSDALGKAWMVLLKPSHEAWRDGLVTGSSVATAFAAWLASEAYKDRQS